MKSSKTYLLLLLAAICFGSLPLRAEEVSDSSAAKDEKASLSVKGMQDNGTCPDGVTVIPESMAMRCGISCDDAKDSEKIRKCLDTLVSDGRGSAIGKQDATITRDFIMHQMSQKALELSVTSKAAAGNYEETQEADLAEDGGVQPGSAAAGGEAIAPTGDDISTKQGKNIKISTRNADTVLKIIDVYSTRVGLDFIEYFYRWDAPYRKIETESSEGEDNG